MGNRRLLIGTIIKLLVMVGLLVLVIVFINSIFVDDSSVRSKVKNKSPIANIDVADMRKGKIKKVRWNNKEVAVLFRQFPEKLNKEIVDNTKNTKSPTEAELHSSINAVSRSKKIEYFVYFNTGDSKNCPLYYAGGVFKDTCSSNRFDEAGRNVSSNPVSYKLQIPPHYFDQQQLIIGKWSL